MVILLEGIYNRVTQTRQGGKNGNKSDVNVSQYPSVGLAYEATKSSYDVMVERFDAANSRIQNILTWAVGITAIIPIFAKGISGNSNFTSPWFISALSTFLALLVVGIVAHRMGGIKLISPEIIYNKYLSHSEEQFKREMIYWSGQHFNTNQQFINKKSLCVDVMTILLGAEVIFARFFPVV